MAIQSKNQRRTFNKGNLETNVLLGQNNGVGCWMVTETAQVEIMNTKNKLMEEIISRLTELKVDKTDLIAELGINKFDGENQDVEEFLNQFVPYLDTWGEKNHFRH